MPPRVTYTCIDMNISQSSPNNNMNDYIPRVPPLLGTNKQIHVLLESLSGQGMSKLQPIRTFTAGKNYNKTSKIVLYRYGMVGNFREVFIFAFFASQEPFARKLKPRKFCCPRVKRTNRVLIPGLLLYI